MDANDILSCTANLDGGFTVMSTATPLTYEIEKSEDETMGRVTTVTLHGRVVTETAAQLKEMVKPLIASGGRIVLDFSNVTHVDSTGLGALVGLKLSAINAGYCRLGFEHLSERVKELLRLTNLTELFKS
jgi:anti-sigma B factor antagonist